jgi:hypothetical protein
LGFGVRDIRPLIVILILILLFNHSAEFGEMKRAGVSSHLDQGAAAFLPPL